jgi:type IX secretion system PorP/SprF family membrane protein
MKKIILSIVLAFTVFSLSAQQDPLFSHYMFNRLLVNPAYAGVNGDLSVVAGTRHQWTGLEGAPSTQTLSVHLPYNDQLGLGVSVIRDQAGPLTNLSFNANFSYQLKLNESSNLSFGLMGGANNANIQLTSLEGVDPSDVSFHSDINQYKPVFGAGLYYYSEKMYAGISAPDLVESVYESTSSTWQHNRHIYFMSGFVANLSDQLKLRPSVLLRYAESVPVSVELNTNLVIQDKYWVGLLYRYNDAIGALVSMQIASDLQIAYSYDYSFNMLRGYQGGSHQVSVAYNMKIRDKQFANPRFL